MEISMTSNYGRDEWAPTTSYVVKMFACIHQMPITSFNLLILDLRQSSNLIFIPNFIVKHGAKTNPQ